MEEALEIRLTMETRTVWVQEGVFYLIIHRNTLTEVPANQTRLTLKNKGKKRFLLTKVVLGFPLIIWTNFKLETIIKVIIIKSFHCNKRIFYNKIRDKLKIIIKVANCMLMVTKWTLTIKLLMDKTIRPGKVFKIHWYKFQIH